MSIATAWFDRAALDRAGVVLGMRIAGDLTSLGEADGAYGTNVLNQFSSHHRGAVKAALMSASHGRYEPCWVCGEPGRPRATWCVEHMRSDHCGREYACHEHQ